MGRPRKRKSSGQSLGTMPKDETHVSAPSLPSGCVKVRLVSAVSSVRIMDELTRQEFIVTAGDSRTFFLKPARVAYLRKLGFVLREVK